MNPDPISPSPARRQKSLVLPGSTPVDWLFVIDDSGSMCEEQAALGRMLETLAPALDAHDYRLTVVSTDLRSEGERGLFLARPAAPVPALNCIDPETMEPQVPDTADCQDRLDAGELPAIVGAPGHRPPVDQLADVLRCMTTLGTMGDGFEMGLEAMRLALSCDGPNAGAFARCCDGARFDPACDVAADAPDAPQFLRPDAMLAVVFVADEDDCSPPAVNPARARRAICRYGTADADGNSLPDGFSDPDLCDGADPAACYRAECGLLEPEACHEARCTISRSDNSNCAWGRDTLTPVADYFEFLNGLKARPREQIAVLSFVGDRLFTEAGDEVVFEPGAPEPPCDPDHEDFDPDRTLSECCPEGVCPGPVQPVCESDLGIAYSGRRYAELAEMLGDNGCDPGGAGGRRTPCSICGSPDAVFEPIADLARATASLAFLYCFDEAPACLVAAPDGALAECSTADERADPARYAVSIDIECGEACREPFARRPLTPEEWALALDTPDCPSRIGVRFREAPPTGATLHVDYLVGPP